MKKIIILFLAVSLLLCSAASASGLSFYARYSAFGTSSDLNGALDGDLFSVDVYMMTGLDAYIVTTIWKNTDASVSVKYARLKTKTNDPGNFYFVFADGSYLTGRYGDEYHATFLLDLTDDCTIKLKDVEEFNPYFDLIK